jgi:hypothetical protein
MVRQHLDVRRDDFGERPLLDPGRAALIPRAWLLRGAHDWGEITPIYLLLGLA